MTSRYVIPLLCLTSLSAQTSKVIETYCSGCHTGRMRSPSGAVLAALDTAQIRESGRLGASLPPASGRNDAARGRAPA